MEDSKMFRRLSLALACLGLLLAAAPLPAHHAFSAEFDATRPIKLNATLTRVEWVNPHAWLHISVKDANGAVTNWMGELGAPNALLRSGWTRDTLQVGMQLVLEGYLAKDGTRKMTAMNVLLPNGSKLFSGSRGIGAPEEPGTK
jgi:hypothetical protein